MKFRQVKYPIKFKIIVMITLILGASILIYVFIAHDLFKKDKSAYVYENSLAFSENLSNQIGMYLQDIGQRIAILSTAYQMEKNKDLLVLEKLLEVNPDFLDFSIYHRKANHFEKKLLICNQNLKETKQNGGENNACEDFVKDSLLGDGDADETQLFRVKKIVSGGQTSQFIVSLGSKESNLIFSARINFSKLADMVLSSHIYKSWVVTESGEIFFHGDSLLMLSNMRSQEMELQNDIISSGHERGVRERIRDDGQRVLFSYAKIPGPRLFVISEISHDKAFQVARYLIDTSLNVALLVLSLSIIVGIIFSRSITEHIQRLFDATLKIAKGDFQSSVIVKSRDEVGALADSFNFMAKEIRRYMEEMKEKVRLENEVAVAQLVQSSFFPDSDIRKEYLSLSAFYRPASECGGDWWGQIDFEGKTLLILVDATGHGVPAALLTATINACAANLKSISKYDSELLRSPAKILSFMNEAVCSAGRRVMLTCFVGLVDPINGVLRFSNASHNPPLYVSSVPKQISKENIHPLMGALGPRLGHEIGGKYIEEEIKIKFGDILIMYTDGLVECLNDQGQNWGKRRFLKSIVENIKKEPKEMKEAIVDSALTFYKKDHFEDDITLLVAKVEKS